jgi:uncharacterized protein YcbK (DUF882 family)
MKFLLYILYPPFLKKWNTLRVMRSEFKDKMNNYKLLVKACDYMEVSSRNISSIRKSLNFNNDNDNEVYERCKSAKESTREELSQLNYLIFKVRNEKI